jgi:hypothetical protein
VTRIQRDSIAYLFVIGFSLFMLVWAIPKYTPEYPGYGASAALVPNVAVSVMLLMAAISLITIGIAAYTKKPMPIEEREFPEDLEEDNGFTQIGRVHLIQLARIMIPSVLLVVATEYIGYVFTAIAFLIIFQYVIGNRKWIQMAVLSIVLTAVLYIVMRYGFGVPVPGPQIFS